MLVDTLVDSEWLLRRFRVCETQLWELGGQHLGPADGDIRLAVSATKKADQFTRLQRRIDSAHRNYRNALQELQRLQSEETPEPDPEPKAPGKQTPKPQNGFLPKIHPTAPGTLMNSPEKPDETTFQP